MGEAEAEAGEVIIMAEEEAGKEGGRTQGRTQDHPHRVRRHRLLHHLIDAEAPGIYLRK